jgi:hypothetical protein
MKLRNIVAALRCNISVRELVFMLKHAKFVICLQA